jgi:hypothetical protein
MSFSYLAGVDALGADVGADIGMANRAIRGMRPMTTVQGRRLVMLAIGALRAANAVAEVSQGMFTPSTEMLTAKRNDLIRQLNNIDGTIVASGMSVIPEDGGAAEILRNTALEAIAQFNQVAEGAATLHAARVQLIHDIVDNAVAMYNKGKDALDNAAWYLKATYWIAIVAGVGVVGAVGYGLYRRTSGK